MRPEIVVSIWRSQSLPNFRDLPYKPTEFGPVNTSS
jgi:hypothetical protein